MTTSTTEITKSTPETATICVVGLGYVGLPLGVAFDEEGFDVVGYDIDQDTIASLSGGTDTTGDVGDDAVATSNVTFTTDPSHIEAADTAIITVPTPVDGTSNPDLSFVRSAGQVVGEFMSEGTTVVLESTVYPGVTRNDLVPVLEEASGTTHGEGFNVGYSPERLSPGEEGKGLRDVMKIVSGDTEETLAELGALYEEVVDAGVYRAPSIETAEAAKVVENVQRDVNIALVNELALICDHMDLDTHTVLDAAGTKWNFHDYRPGLVGGHCIPVDPMYIAHGSERAGFTPKLILQSREVNEYMPKHAAELALKALNESGKVLSDCELLLLGLSYKPNVGDIRTSEVEGIISELAEYDVGVTGYDPHADDDAMREHFGIDVQAEPDFTGFDGVVLATPHDEFDELNFELVKRQLNDGPVLVDVRGTLDADRAARAGFVYRRL